MTLHTNVGGVWKDITNVYTNVSGVWKENNEVWSNVSGVWKLVFSRDLSGNIIFNEGAIGNISVAKLTDTKAVVVYRDMANNNYGTARILTLSDNNIIFGPEFVFCTALTSVAEVAALSDTSAIVAYRNGSSASARVLTISGDSVTSAGTVHVFASVTLDRLTITNLTSTTVLVSFMYYYAESHYKVTCCVLTITGTNVTSGASLNVYSVPYSGQISSTTLDSSRVFLAWTGGEYNNRCRILNISGTTVTEHSNQDFNSGSTGYISTAPLTSNTALIAYSDTTSSSYGTVRIASYDTFSTNTLTVGNEYLFNNSLTTVVSIAMLNSTKAIVVYGNTSAYSYGMAKIITISGSNILMGAAFTFKAEGISGAVQVIRLTDASALVVYRSMSGEGGARILTISDTTIT